MSGIRRDDDRVSYVEPVVPRMRRGLRFQVVVVAAAVGVLGAVSAGVLAPLSAAAPAAVGSCTAPGPFDPGRTSVVCPPPVANNDAYSTPQNTVLTVPAPGVLSNDEAPTGENSQPVGLEVADSDTSGTKGTVALDGNGALTYTPPAGFVGTDTFTYRAQNQTFSHEKSQPATVTITVTAPPTQTANRVRGAGILTTGSGQRLSLSVDAQVTTTGVASGRVAASGGPTFGSRTITGVRRQGATATVTGTATGPDGVSGPFTLTVTDRGTRGDQVTVTFGRTTTTGTLTTGDITVTG